MQGRRLGKTILLGVVFLLIISQPVTAYNVSKISVEPAGAVLSPGTPVSVSVKIDFPTQPLFPPSYGLRYSTELEKPKWDPDILAAGVEYPAIIKGGKVNSFSGFELSDPRVFAVRLQLEGIAPSVLRTSNITIIRIEELDELGRVIDKSTIESTAVILYFDEYSFCDLSTFCQSQLQKFRNRIDEMAALGVNTSIAEAKYNEAQQKIISARAYPSTQYVKYLNDLNATQTAIKDGENALDKAWAEAEVANAEIPIKNVNVVIAWYRQNPSTMFDLKLPAIVAKREMAADFISDAKQAINIGNYSQAREKAQDAYGYANESYYIALSEQQHPCSGVFCNFNPWMFGFLITGILVIASTGLFFYSRKLG